MTDQFAECRSKTAKKITSFLLAVLMCGLLTCAAAGSDDIGDNNIFKGIEQTPEEQSPEIDDAASETNQPEDLITEPATVTTDTPQENESSETTEETLPSEEAENPEEPPKNNFFTGIIQKITEKIPAEFLIGCGGFILGILFTVLAANLIRLVKKLCKKKSKFTGKIQVCNVHHIGNRNSQQDSFCISNVMDENDVRNKGVMGVVADGMGGLQSGDKVSQLVTDIYLQRYRSMNIPDPQAFLMESAYAAEQHVDEYMRREHVDGGSTLVAVMIKDQGLRFVSVGDSFIFLIRGNTVQQLNRLHNFREILQERVERGEITQKDADENKMQASLTAYIGMGQITKIDSSPQDIPLQSGDVVCLCSDGVYNALGSDKLVQVIQNGKFDEAGERMEKAILDQKLQHQDNFTAILLKYNK